jgi:hypothetical protein
MATPNERRERWEKSVAHKLEHGLRSERDPVFLAWIEEWIAGHISIRELQERYASLLMSRDRTGIAPNDDVATVLMEEIRQELPEVGDVGLRRAIERSKTTRAIDAAWKIDD